MVYTITNSITIRTRGILSTFLDGSTFDGPFCTLTYRTVFLRSLPALRGTLFILEFRIHIRTNVQKGSTILSQQNRPPLMAGGSFANAKRFGDDATRVPLLQEVTELGPIASFKMFGVPLVVVVTGPQEIEELSQNPKIQRSEATARLYEEPFGQNTVVVDGDVWKEHRHWMNPSFHRKNMPKWQAINVAEAKRALATLAANDHYTPGLFTWGSKFAWDAMSILQYSEYLPYQGKEVIIDLLNTAIPAMIPRSFVPDFVYRLPRVGPIAKLRAGYDAYRKALDASDQFTTEVITKRRVARAAGQRFDDLLDVYLDMQEAGVITAKGVGDQVKMTFSAGQDTTANALACVLHWLAQYPEIERQVRDEVRGILGDRDPAAEDIKLMVFLQSVIAESLRRYPPAPFFFREATEELTLGGYTIPEKSMIVVASFITHMKYGGAHPEKLIPDRVLPHKFSSIPFGVGKNLCIGKPLAELELATMLAMIYQRYDRIQTVAPLTTIGTTLQAVDQSARFVPKQ